MFTEDWFGPASQQVLARLVHDTPAGAAIVEVGCWEGRSTVALANAVRPETVHAVDTWEGSPGEPSWDLAHMRDVYSTFLDNVKHCGNVVPHQMTWQEYFVEHRDPVRFCHIDAEHTFEQVHDNIAAVLEVLVPGGIICGDDAHHPPVIAAVRSHFGDDYDIEATLWIWRKEA